MSDELRRWVCCTEKGVVEEWVGRHAPKKSFSGRWWSGGGDCYSLCVTDMPIYYERLTGIHLAPGEGPVELEVRAKEGVSDLYDEITKLRDKSEFQGEQLTALREAVRALVETLKRSLAHELSWEIAPVDVKPKLAAVEALLPKEKQTEGDDDG